MGHQWIQLSREIRGWWLNSCFVKSLGPDTLDPEGSSTSKEVLTCTRGVERGTSVRDSTIELWGYSVVHKDQNVRRM